MANFNAEDRQLETLNLSKLTRQNPKRKEIKLFLILTRRNIANIQKARPGLNLTQDSIVIVVLIYAHSALWFDYVVAQYGR